MKTNDESTGAETQASAAAVGLATSRAERRRALLKGIGTGSALMAAAVPIKTLAGQNVLTYDGTRHCSISGVMSNIHSATPVNAQTCDGFSPTYWGKGKGTTPTNAWPSTCKSTTNCRTLLPGCSINQPAFTVMNSATYSSAPERHWICALLNAQTKSTNFPYSTAEVISFYQSTTAQHANALNFFVNWTERRNA